MPNRSAGRSHRTPPLYSVCALQLLAKSPTRRSFLRTQMSIKKVALSIASFLLAIFSGDEAMRSNRPKA